MLPVLVCSFRFNLIFLAIFWVFSPFLSTFAVKVIIDGLLEAIFPQSPCESAPCMNGAVCVPEYESNFYHCDCKPGFCGTDCEQGGIKSVNILADTCIIS